MGAFIIADIGFKTEKDRIKFEEWKDIKCRNIIVDEMSNSYNFCAWQMLRNPLLNPIYNLGFMGYEDPVQIVKDAKKKGIKITFFAFIPINDKNSNWRKLIGKW